MQRPSFGGWGVACTLPRRPSSDDNGDCKACGVQNRKSYTLQYTLHRDPFSPFVYVLVSLSSDSRFGSRGARWSSCPDETIEGTVSVSKGPRGMMSLIAAVISVVQVVWAQGERWKKLGARMEDNRPLEDLALHVGSTSRSAFPHRGQQSRGQEGTSQALPADWTTRRNTNATRRRAETRFSRLRGGAL
ncbi:hypothetical protein VTN00DRAFT_6000 [Thermoascus crustaceus]|uniref:uncharacterized protein n=1 Tax=Thermoascus crustaceus TaxID=5088 RepID=UPI00374347A3